MKEEIFENGMTENKLNGIGTYNERTLHAFLKKYYEQDESYHEVRYKGYIADIKRNENITEIQTSSFGRMKEKIVAFTEECDVTVVYPVPYEKHIIWIDPENGEMTKPRKSGKRGNIYEIFRELVMIKPYLINPRLYFKVVLVDIDEYRNLCGWSKDRKRGSVRVERIPKKISGEIDIKNLYDMANLIPKKISRCFTTALFASEVNITQCLAEKVVNVMKFCGVIEPIGKDGRRIQYGVVSDFVGPN